jgi:hypothetical protein
MAILHFKVCMPLRWLAGNTLFLGQQGHKWSTRSMGKAIDALYDAMAAIRDYSSLYLKEDFMNSIFTKYISTTTVILLRSLHCKKQ